MNINNAIARAQRLMLSEDFNNRVESAAGAYSGKSKKNRGANDSSLAMLEAQAFGTPMPSQKLNYQVTGGHGSMLQNDGNIQMLQETRETRNMSESKLPKAVLDSFNEMGPLTGDDSLEMPPASYYPNYAAPQQLNEQAMQMMQPQPQYAPQQTGVDYNYISHLVSEAVKSAMKSLNESTGIVRGLRIGEGGKIQFLDTKGNLFEGTLTLKKKAQNK